jgi:soluble lytic murein transglycosylase
MAASSTQRRPARRRVSSRPRTSRQRIRLRRAFALAAALLAGLGVGYVLFHDSVDKVIEELTLPLRHEDIIRQQAREKGVEASLIAAVIYAESRFSDQTSSAGARGLMQITPATAKDIERRSGGTTFTVEDLSDPQINISYGTYHLRDLLDMYSGNEVAALAAYNAGPGNADAWGGSEMSVEDIGYPETRAYVEAVLDKREAYRRKYAKELGY